MTKNVDVTFSDTPLFVIEAFLQFYDQVGGEASNIPDHVIHELAARFRSFMDGELQSLDEAFGGGVARQRQRIKRIQRDIAMCHAVHALTIPNNPIGGTLEKAIAVVAEENWGNEVTEEVVRKAWNQLGRQLYPNQTRVT